MPHPALVIETLSRPTIAERRVELVERKGLGHPDTICDCLVESIAIALNQMYVERLGMVAHYNVDKALLVAGQCRKTFGHGEILQPMELIVGDRATAEVGGRTLPVEETARAAVDDWLAQHLPLARPHVRVRNVLAPGSAELTAIFESGALDIASNDTSAASGYAPLSPAEAAVLEIERFLNGPDFKARFPDTGQDVKVFGRRLDDRLSVTVAMPLLAAATPSETAYFQRKEEIVAALGARLAGGHFAFEWKLNNLDVPGRGSDGVYLTVTGTSAEDADSGQVGRGNRANGLIAFSRPNGGEATAGKNAVAHAGKIYGVLSHRLAAAIHARVSGIAEVYVHLAARIGEPVDRPWVAVQLVLDRAASLGDIERDVRETVETEIARLPEFRAALGRGEFSVC